MLREIIQGNGIYCLWIFGPDYAKLQLIVGLLAKNLFTNSDTFAKSGRLVLDSLGNFLIKNAVELRPTQLLDAQELIVGLLPLAVAATGPDGDLDEGVDPGHGVGRRVLDEAPGFLLEVVGVDGGTSEFAAGVLLRARDELVLGDDGVVDEDGAVLGRVKLFESSCDEN